VTTDSSVAQHSPHSPYLLVHTYMYFSGAENHAVSAGVQRSMHGYDMQPWCDFLRAKMSLRFRATRGRCCFGVWHEVWQNLQHVMIHTCDNSVAAVIVIYDYVITVIVIVIITLAVSNFNASYSTSWSIKIWHLFWTITSVFLENLLVPMETGINTLQITYLVVLTWLMTS